LSEEAGGGCVQPQTGTSYDRRSQLKAPPFDETLVGNYVFLAGLSGAAALLSTLLDVTRGRAAASAIFSHATAVFYHMIRVFKSMPTMIFGNGLLIILFFADYATTYG